MENKVGKVGTKYKCISCNYIARDKFNYDKHLHTIKHYKLTNPEKIEIVEPTIYKCANCATCLMK